MNESNTIKSFKMELIKSLPYFPNTGETKRELESQHINEVMLRYLTWASRIIPIRTRTIHTEPYLILDKRFNEQKNDIAELLHCAKNGGDLTPYLSNKAITKGYAPKEYKLKQFNQWLDKDQLLEKYGFHHLHLKPGKSNKGNDLLFAQISRDNFKAIALFDHSVFEQNFPLSSENIRLTYIYHALIEKQFKTNSAYLSISHQWYIYTMNMAYIRCLDAYDPLLQDKKFINHICSTSEIPIHPKAKLKWLLLDLDLGLYETKSQQFFILRYGHM